MLALPFPERPSAELRNPELWERYLANPQNPALVSFPRTGSHWLRMLMELQFERPTLVRIFYYFDAQEFLCWHTHDDDLTFERERVIYLHRDPIDTVYSQLCYQRVNPFEAQHVLTWSARYLAHLQKWMGRPNRARDKLILSYDELRSAPVATLRRLAEFFKLPWNPMRAEEVVSHVSRQKIHAKVVHDDDRVINLRPDYGVDRDRFRKEFGALIKSKYLASEAILVNVFDP